MNRSEKKQGVFKPVGRRVWPHEDCTADILASHGHYIEFLPESRIGSTDFLISQVKTRKKIKNMLFVNKRHELIDIFTLV